MRALATDDWHHNKQLKLDRKWLFENGPRDRKTEREKRWEKIKTTSELEYRIDWMILMFKKVTCRFAIAARYFKLFSLMHFIKTNHMCLHVQCTRAAVACNRSSNEPTGKKRTKQKKEYVFRLGETQLEKHQPKMISALRFVSTNVTKAKLILALEFQFVPHIRSVCVCVCVFFFFSLLGFYYCYLYFVSHSFHSLIRFVSFRV